MSDFAVLIERKRGKVAEIMVHGAVVWVHGDQVIHSVGQDPQIFGRSLMKPYQIKAIEAQLTGLSATQQAIAISSHSGTDKHIAMAQSLLNAEHWPKLLTPAALPLGGGTAQSQWHHPCSGKHAAIIRACLVNGWPTAQYTSTEHPYHQAYLAQLNQVLVAEQAQLTACPDGCGLPTIAHRVSDLASCFAHLAQQRNHDWIWSAMTENPWWIGGDGRMDSEIMAVTNGQVLAKEGADGLLGLALCNDQYPQGLGIVLKIAHGRDELSMKLIAAKILAQLGFDWPVTDHNQEQPATVSEHCCLAKVG